MARSDVMTVVYAIGKGRNPGKASQTAVVLPITCSNRVPTGIAGVQLFQLPSILFLFLGIARQEISTIQ
tara:strand:- start:766 stop:972 length:207 start_codon:yes stop_codon:yes gene_type:complete